MKLIALWCEQRLNILSLRKFRWVNVVKICKMHFEISNVTCGEFCCEIKKNKRSFLRIFSAYYERPEGEINVIRIFRVEFVNLNRLIVSLQCSFSV